MEFLSGPLDELFFRQDGDVDGLCEAICVLWVIMDEIQNRAIAMLTVSDEVIGVRFECNRMISLQFCKIRAANRNQFDRPPVSKQTTFHGADQIISHYGNTTAVDRTLDTVLQIDNSL